MSWRLRHHAEFLDDLAGKAAYAHLQALEILDGVDLFAVPAAHLRACIAAGKPVQSLRVVELVQQVVAAAIVHPGVHLTHVHAEGDGRRQCEGGVLAPIVV